MAKSLLYWLFSYTFYIYRERVSPQFHRRHSERVGQCPAIINCLDKYMVTLVFAFKNGFPPTIGENYATIKLRHVAAQLMVTILLLWFSSAYRW